MNLIFHDLLGIILEIYIDDVVVKSGSMGSHLADLRLALERMHRYGLKMNPLKCVFSVLAGKSVYNNASVYKLFVPWASNTSRHSVIHC
jgi:hypothetical protein